MMVPIIDIRSSWIVSDGWAHQINPPKPHQPFVAPKIERALTKLEIAKAEIARRIRAKGGR